MKFLHAADIHLDSPLAGLARRGSALREVTRDCTRRAFANLIDLAIAEDVAFVLIAGDLYDGDWRDFSTGLFFAREMRRLDRPCIIVRGNHDAASLVSKELTAPSNVHVMSSRRVDRWVSDELGVVIDGRSFPDRHIPEDFSAAYPGPPPGKFSIAMLHTSAEDPGEHAVYAPCSVAALAARGYDYWALGHVHERRVLREHPHIVFPGNIQGRHARETGAKGVTLVEVRDRRVVGIVHRAIDVLRWAVADIDVGGAETMAEVAARLRIAFEAQARRADGRPLLLRVHLRGPTMLHGGLLADPAAIEAECDNAALAAGADMHIERVLLDTRPAARVVAAPSADLAEAFSEALHDEEVAARLLAEFARLRRELPTLAGQPAPPLPGTLDELRALVPDAWQLAAMALQGGERR